MIADRHYIAAATPDGHVETLYLDVQGALRLKLDSVEALLSRANDAWVRHVYLFADGQWTYYRDGKPVVIAAR